MRNKWRPSIVTLVAGILLAAGPAIGVHQQNPARARRSEVAGRDSLGFDTTAMCGPNCLWQIACAYGRPCSLDAIRSLAQTDIKNGTTMMGMVEAARQIGLQAVGVKTNIRALAHDPRIAILLLNLGDSSHYVILDRIEAGNVRLLDGGRFRELSVRQLQSVWDGHAIVIGRPPNGDQNGLRVYFGTALHAAGWLLTFALIVFSLWRMRFRMLRSRAVAMPSPRATTGGGR